MLGAHSARLAPSALLQTPASNHHPLRALFIVVAAPFLMDPETRSPPQARWTSMRRLQSLSKQEKPLRFQGDRTASASCLWWPARWCPPCCHNGPSPRSPDYDISHGQRVSAHVCSSGWGDGTGLPGFPGGSVVKNGFMYMCNWAALLYSSS